MDQSEGIEQLRDELTAEMATTNVTILNEGTMMEEEQGILTEVFQGEATSSVSDIGEDEIESIAEVHSVNEWMLL